MKNPNKQYLNSASIDLLVGCGLWTLPLFALTYLLNLQSLIGVGFFFYFLGNFSNNPHYMATIYRAYGRRENFEKYRFFTIYITMIVLMTIIVAHSFPLFFPLVWTIYLIWSPWHYTGQNYGIAMMFVRRGGINPDPKERNLLHYSFIASYICWLVDMQSSGMVDPYVLNLGIPQDVAVPLRSILLVIFLVCGVWSLVSMSRNGEARKLLPATVLLMTQFLWFLAPGIIKFMTGGNLTPTTYAGGVLAFMHCTQYLWITSYYTKKEMVVTQGKDQRGWSPWRYYAILFIGGAALFLPGPWLVSYVFNFDYMKSYLIFFSLVNLHHFILDGAVWKLRDKRVGKLLLDTPEKSTQGISPLDNGRQKSLILWKVTGAFVGLFLTLLVAADLLQYYMTQSDSTEKQLSLAGKINPNDSRVYSAQAMKFLDQGNALEASKQIRIALALDSYGAKSDQILGNSLMASSKLEEAFILYSDMEKKYPQWREVSGSLGIVALQTGHYDIAADRLGKIYLRNPKDMGIILPLSIALQMNGEYERAIPLLEKYIAVMSQQNGHAVNVRDHIQAAISLADAYWHVGRLQDAVYWMELAHAGAREYRLQDMEMTAGKYLDEMKNSSGPRR